MAKRLVRSSILLEISPNENGTILPMLFSRIFLIQPFATVKFRSLSPELLSRTVLIRITHHGIAGVLSLNIRIQIIHASLLIISYIASPKCLKKCSNRCPWSGCALDKPRAEVIITRTSVEPIQWKSDVLINQLLKFQGTYLLMSITQQSKSVTHCLNCKYIKAFAGKCDNIRRA